jgi:hypothetical protein
MFFNTPKTVASVVASFQQTINDLSIIAEKQTEQANKLTIEITQLEAAKTNALEESIAAQNISDKIRNLISA